MNLKSFITKFSMLLVGTHEIRLESVEHEQTHIFGVSEVHKF